MFEFSCSASSSGLHCIAQHGTARHSAAFPARGVSSDTTWLWGAFKGFGHCVLALGADI